MSLEPSENLRESGKQSCLSYNYRCFWVILPLPMAIPMRIEFPGAVYHITSRGNARQDIFLYDRDSANFS